MARRVLFRVDAGPAIGTGHVVRCRTLARSLIAKGIEAHFVSAEMLGPFANELVSDGVICHSVLVADEAGRVADLCRELDVAFCIVDGYGFSTAYVETIADSARIFYVDDIGVVPPRCTGVLNSNLYAEELTYPLESKTERLLGPRYALVRESFRRARAARAELVGELGRAPRVLVTMGGSDLHGVTLRALSELPGTSEIRVTVSAMSPHAAEVEATANKLGERVTVLRGVLDLAPHMLWSDVAVVAAGTTCLELACVGVPMLLVATADNQRRVEAAFAGRAIGVGLGWHSDMEDGALHLAFTRLMGAPAQLRRMSARLREVVDGNGSERVASWISVRA